MMTTAMMITPVPVLGAVSASPLPPVTLATLDLPGVLVISTAVAAALVALVVVRAVRARRRLSDMSVADRAVPLPLAA